MSGLVAIFNPEGVKASLSALVRRFPSRAGKRDEWEDARFKAARFHHGILNTFPQPVWDESRTLCLFMDGEYFGPAPGSSPADGTPASQPEACLAAFRRDPQAFATLNGSFALIVYDAQRGTISLVSDRLNTRPLYYFQAGSELVVSSHIAALTAHPKCPKTLDRQSLHELVTYRQVLGNNTIYRGIRWMEPASIVTFDGRAISAAPYWHLRWREPEIAKEELPGLIAEGIRNAVRRRLSENARPGLLLSGGLDSRIILAASDAPPVCCTLGDVETDQLKCAREAAAICGAEHHFLYVSPEDFWANFEEGVRLTGGMYGYQQNHFLPVLDRVRSHCDVVFSGSYLDTILRGSFMPARKIAIGGFRIGLPWPADLPHTDLASLLVHTQKTANPMPLVRSILSESALAEHESRLESGMREAVHGFESPYLHHAWSYLMMRSMPHNLGFPNVLSIRSRMDVAILAWDHELLDIALQMPPDWSMPDTAYRKALALLSPPLARLEYANEGLPATANPFLRTAYRFVTGSMRTVETRLLDRRPLNGSASWLDFNGLLRRPGPLNDRLRALPTSEALATCGMFSPSGLQAAVDRHLERKANIGKFLIMLLTIDNWISQYGADGIPDLGNPGAGTRNHAVESTA